MTFEHPSFRAVLSRLVRIFLYILVDINDSIGMQNKALHIIDLDNPRHTRSFLTHSDVFSLHCDKVGS